MVFNYSHQNANGTGALATVPVLLHGVTINTKGASSNVLTLYDGDGATVIAVIDTTQNVGFLKFRAQTKSGLQFKLATGTAADVTITFG